MKREIKLWEYGCESCSKTIVVRRTQYDYTLPKGWEEVSEYHDSGCMGGGYRGRLLCGACSKKEKKKQKQEVHAGL